MASESKQRGVLIGVAATAVISLVTAIWALANDRSSALADIETNNRAVVDHETRIRTVESALPGMASDLAWIRQTLEKQQKPHGGN